MLLNPRKLNTSPPGRMNTSSGSVDMGMSKAEGFIETHEMIKNADGIILTENPRQQ